jgi:hypothetical protein
MSSSCIFLQPSVTLSILGNPLSTLFSNTLSLHSSHNTTEKLLVLIGSSTVLTLCCFLTIIEYVFYAEFLQVSSDRDQLFLNRPDWVGIFPPLFLMMKTSSFQNCLTNLKTMDNIQNNNHAYFGHAEQVCLISCRSDSFLRAYFRDSTCDIFSWWHTFGNLCRWSNFKGVGSHIWPGMYLLLLRDMWVWILAKQCDVSLVWITLVSFDYICEKSSSHICQKMPHSQCWCWIYQHSISSI